jgi:hypothetical protein
MLMSTPLYPPYAYPDQMMDEALRKAFGPILAEEMPPRLRAAFDALCKIGSSDDASETAG